MTPDTKYSQLVSKFIGRNGVTGIAEGKGFGSTGQLKVNGRIFAMLVRGELVLKLPRSRVDELVKQEEGVRFDAGKGKPMREWFVLSAASNRSWTSLAQEALDFVQERKQ
ncbi:MAG: TfoX/Sxy family protein [Chloroflexi bacterium]|nr:MAG: TfoX/Sxy family protein [Chloroflexota bacterium]